MPEQKKKKKTCSGDVALYQTTLTTFFTSHPFGIEASAGLVECCHKHIGMSVCNTHTHLFNGPFSGTAQVSRYQKGKTNLDFTGARDSEWQWHQLGHMQVCISLQTDNHASTLPLCFLQARCPSCRPTNSVKSLKAPFTILKSNTK